MAPDLTDEETAALTRLLRTTGFDRIVTVAETIEEAAAALEKNVAVEE